MSAQRDRNVEPESGQEDYIIKRENIAHPHIYTRKDHMPIQISRNLIDSITRRFFESHVKSHLIMIIS
jgi:hypothetical protein